MVEARGGLAVFLAVLLVGAPLTAQLSVSVLPQPGSFGGTYDVMLGNKTGLSVDFLDGCFVNQARAGSSEGPLLWEPWACPDVVITLPDQGSLETTWTAVDLEGHPLPAGPLALRISYQPAGTPSLVHQWILLQHAPALPVLHPLGGARVGERTIMQLSLQDRPGAFYVTALSMGATSQPFAPNAFLLVPDQLLVLSLQAPQNAFFQNLQGNLDSDGIAWNIGVQVPLEPSLVGQSFHVQALVGITETDPLFSNLLSFVIAGEDE